MADYLKLKLSLDEANTILSALGNLPYVQVHKLIHNLQNQVGPQLAEMDRNCKHVNGVETNSAIYE